MEPIFPSDFPLVYGLLRRLDGRRTPEKWRTIFDYSWRTPEQPVGYAVRARGAIVAFVGTILSEMIVEGRRERFCNITSWVTDEDHRGSGALLVLPLARLQDVTVTNLTSSPQALPAFTRLGFQILDTTRTTLRPASRMLARRRQRCRIVADHSSMVAVLSDGDRQIMEDHLRHAQHVLAVCNEGYCYVVYTVRSRWLLPTARFHYVSNRTLFKACWPTIQQALLARNGTILGETDSRLLTGIVIPGSTESRMKVPRLFKSPSLAPPSVSELYSEIVLLKI